MKYKVYSQDSFGLKQEVFTTDSYSKAYQFCKRRNNDTAHYLQECEENREQAGITINYWFEKVDAHSAEPDFKLSYYTIYKEQENGIRQFVCIVDQEWIAKDFCKRHDRLVYEKTEVKENAE